MERALLSGFAEHLSIRTRIIETLWKAYKERDYSRNTASLLHELLVRDVELLKRIESELVLQLPLNLEVVQPGNSK